MNNRISRSLLVSAVAMLPAAAVHSEELPAPVRAIEARGAQVVGSFDAPGGLKGYAARFNGQGMALYLTPDEQHVLVGSLFDHKGEDISRPVIERLVYEPLGKEMWGQLEGSTWIADGAADAPRIIYMFSDPNCPFCSMFWKQARPWVEAGTVQVRHVMVGMLRADSVGKAAALLSAANPETALAAHESAGRASKLEPLADIPTPLAEKLEANLQLMRELGAAATPAIYYMNEDGHLQQQQGAPRPDVLSAIMGPLPDQR